LAYENGAKFVVVLDTNKGYNATILKQEHFDALKQFWKFAKDNPRPIADVSDRVAYVLPKDYGYGFRGPNDKIWGFWQADNLTGVVCSDLSNLLRLYDERLDIIYEDGLSGNGTCGYSRLVFWNGTVRTS
jgi:hypothetical protein